MEVFELLEIIARGEDGKHQFKTNITNPDALAAEMVAFSNSEGGTIFIGVNNDGSINGLQRSDIDRLNQMVSNAASQIIRPPINPQTENIETQSGLIMVIKVAPGISKPYMDNNGHIWVKSGSDKRKATSREEMQRLFQAAGLVHGDEIPVSGLTVADLDVDYFKDFFEAKFSESIDEQGVSLSTLLENMNLMHEGVLNVSGALLFARHPNFKLPACIVKCISYPGNDIDQEHYMDSQDVAGKIADIYAKTINFVLRNIRHIQGDKGVNSLGDPEIPRIVLEEIIANALIHRDYFISAPIRLFIFKDRIEMISPGHLPNNLTVANIKSGNSNMRNPILASYATRVLPYRGLGNGIIRAIKAYKDIEFYDDRDGNLFKVTIKRPLFD
jgi:ATP-dependent DNA helicase RecG